jgi:hypothetical protein
MHATTVSSSTVVTFVSGAPRSGCAHPSLVADMLARVSGELKEGEELATADVAWLRRLLEGEVLPRFDNRKKELANMRALVFAMGRLTSMEYAMEYAVIFFLRCSRPHRMAGHTRLRLDGVTGRPRREPLARYSAIEGALRSRLLA